MLTTATPRLPWVLCGCCHSCHRRGMGRGPEGTQRGDVGRDHNRGAWDPGAAPASCLAQDQPWHPSGLPAFIVALEGESPPVLGFCRVTSKRHGGCSPLNIPEEVLESWLPPPSLSPSHRLPRTQELAAVSNAWGLPLKALHILSHLSGNHVQGREATEQSQDSWALDIPGI